LNQASQIVVRFILTLFNIMAVIRNSVVRNHLLHQK